MKINCKRLGSSILTAAALLFLLPIAARAEEAKDAMQRGRVALQKGDLDGAIAAFTAAIRLDPKLTAAYLTRGWVYGEKGEFQKAIADYDQAINLDPKSAEAFCNRGDLLAKNGQIDRGLADLTAAIRLNPKLVPAYAARGFIYSEQGAHEKAAADYGEVIRLVPQDPQAYIDRATCLAELKKDAAAIADLDAAIKLGAKDPRVYGARGAAHLHLGNYRQGAADLQAAIRLNPEDAGAKYAPSTKKELPAEALRHGQEQVRRMLRDRPTMTQFGKETEFLNQWAARKFAGEDFGEPFDWDPTPPKDSDAENVAPVNGRRGLIRVEAVHSFGPKRGAPRTFEEVWAAAVFECHNITYARKFLQFHQEAAAGKLTKGQFVAGIWKYEYLAAQQTRAFYVQVFLPWAEKKKLPTDPGLWFAAWWETAADALQAFTDKSSYPWRPYARQYDWMTLQTLVRGGNFKKALALLGQMETEKVYTADVADLYVWMGRCHLELGKPALAVEALGKSIGRDSRKAQAYQLRGEAFQKLGERAKAAADFAKAKELSAGK